MLLIITNESDIHPNPVIDKLSEAGYAFFRLNTDKIVSDYDISCFISNEEYHFEIKYKNAPHSITDKQVTCVWERRPIEPLTTYDHIEDQNVRKAILDEADGFVRYLRYALTFNKDILWIGHPLYERLAGSKMLQKLVARELGMKIPPTLFSNDISTLSFFHEKDVALKPISSFDIPMGDGSIVFYTQKTTPKEISKLGNVAFRNNINFIEEYIGKQYELRITVINGHFLTARVDSQLQDADKGAIDWRQGYDYSIAFVPIDTPPQLKSFCMNFLTYFHLNFGCFDFIKGVDGEYVFLECNTNGQWLWLEESGLDISSALAEVFIEQINGEKNRN